MKAWIMVMGLVIFLSGCSNINNNDVNNPIKGNASIDWVDFVKLNGNTYTGLHESAINNPADVTNEVAGEVEFKVGDVVTNPNYRTKAGDAAFLEIGTKLYRVEGFEADKLIAAKDDQRIGGYRLYVSEDYAKTMRLHYKDMPKDKIERIELYRSNETTPFNTLESDDEKKSFIQLLENGKDSGSYIPQNQDGDPAYYTMVFYTDEPIAYAFSLADDGVNVFFHPWNTTIVDDEIRKYMVNQ